MAASPFPDAEVTGRMEGDAAVIAATRALAGGNRLADMNIPKGTLVMLIKRGNEFLIPNGQMELHPGDKLLVMLDNKIPADT